MAKSDLIGGSLWDNYSQKVSDRMNNPLHRGELTEADAQALGGKLVVADYGAVSCGDSVRLFWIVGADEKILAAKFKSFGCGTAISASDMMVELCLGRTVTEALTINNIEVEFNLRDNPETPAVPPQKMHCSVMAYDAIKEAASIYYGVDRETYEDHQMVCECARVRLGDIKDAIRINNLTTVEQITQYTKAGGFCKSCIKPGGHEEKKFYLVDILEETRREMADKIAILPETPPQDFDQMSIFQKGKLLEEYFQHVISPMLAADGGAASVGDIAEENGRLQLRLNYAGACIGCPSAAGATRMVIENLLRDEVSDRIDVVI
jgi:NifU-like protein